MMDPEQPSGVVPADVPDLSTVDPARVERRARIRKAVERYNNTLRGDADLASELASELGISRATFFRYRKLHQSDPSLMRGLRRQGTGRPGQSRLDPKVESLVDETLRKEYLSDRQRPLASVAADIRTLCIDAGLTPPSSTTVRRRSLRFGRKVIITAREGSKAARDATRPVGGPLEVGRYPLEHVQIDHSPADCWIVDNIERQPLCHPLLTVVLDTYSRAIIGVILTLERGPNALQTAIAIRVSVLPKAPWLAELGLDMEWPMFGLPVRVTTDNGADFVGTAYVSGCDRYGIVCETRPRGQPEKGGHIESGVKIVNRYIRTQPGGVRSQKGKNRDYDPKKQARLTLKELETAVVNWVVGTYNNRPHGKTRQTPTARFLAGLKEAPRTLGEAFPRMPEDLERFQIDFLPVARRKLLKAGIKLNGFTYTSDSLRPLIERHVGDEYLVRFDPRDISYVYVYVPKQDAYFRVFARETDLPSADLWTAREVAAVLRRKGVKQIDERMRVEAIKTERRILGESERLTRTARRRRARLHDGSSASRQLAVSRPDPGTAYAQPEAPTPSPLEPQEPPANTGDAGTGDVRSAPKIEPFDDVEFL